MDNLVRTRKYRNRSQAIQEAVVEKVNRLDRTRLARECAKLDPAEEQAWAELGLATDFENWPEY